MFYDALTGKKGTIFAYIKTKFIKNTKSNINSFWQNKHNVHLYLFQQSYLLSIHYLWHKLQIPFVVWWPSWIVSMASGGKNYKIQCLSTSLSNELTTKSWKVDIILKLIFLFCIVVSGLNPLVGVKVKCETPP